MNEMEFRNDGRVVLFQSIRKMECIYAETKKQGGRKMSSMKVTLQTEEDTLTLESTFSLDEIEQWVTVVRECVMFCIIPAPTGTAGAGAVGSTSAARNDFRSMSGLVFGADVDVEYLIKAVLVDGAVRPEIFPSIAKLCQQVGDIFNRVRDVNCNKDAFGAFSRRLADLLRVMLDPQAGGLLLSVTETDTGLVTFQLNSMCSKGLADASHFVEVMSSTEWLSEALKLGTSGFRAKFEHVEQEIMIKCANKIITGLNGKENTLFKKFNYDMAVEVSQSLHSIGTIEEIYGNPAKIHALARVVQGNAEDIFSELERILEKEDMLGEDAVVTDRDSVQSSADRGGNGPAVAYQEPRRSTESSRGGGLVRLLCCCCFRSKRAAKPTMRRKSYKFSSSSSGSGLEQKLLNNRSSGDRSL